METINMLNLDKETTLKSVSKYLQVIMPIFKSDTLEEGIKELCVCRLCKSVGIKCEYNYKSEFFEFFSCITGEAVCQKLNIHMHLAPDYIRFIKYEHLNLVDCVTQFLETEDKDEAFIDIFNFLDKYKYLIAKLKKV